MRSHTFFTKSVVALLLATVAVMLTSTALAQSGGRGPGFRNGTANGPAATVPLTGEEATSLQFMREEEKLARDVYLELYRYWGAVIFYNIAESEQKHFDAIGKLLTKHGVEDPAEDLSEGEFDNHDLQDLYFDLIEQGKYVLDDALEVGVTIEEKDIEDLEAYLANDITKRDITQVYTNLLAGSNNHLDAFLTGCDLLAVTQ